MFGLEYNLFDWLLHLFLDKTHKVDYPRELLLTAQDLLHELEG